MVDPFGADFSNRLRFSTLSACRGLLLVLAKEQK
jgi:hypothetical protein